MRFSLAGLNAILVLLLLPCYSVQASAACDWRLVHWQAAGIPAWGILTEYRAEPPFSVLTLSPALKTLADADPLLLLEKSNWPKICSWISASKNSPKRHRELKREQILPPLPQPAQIAAAGLNYADHASEVDIDDIRVFPKNLSITSAYSPVNRPEPALLDWEVELALVLSKNIPLSKKIKSEELAEYVLAYLSVNDFSNRIPIIRDTEKGFTQGKTAPGFLPVGPFLTPAYLLTTNVRSGLPDLELRLEVNGQVKQQGKTTEILTPLAEILQLIIAESETEWTNAQGEKQKLLPQGQLQRGDLILTGTPGGTAIRAPNLRKKLALGLETLISWRNPREIFLNEEFCSGKYLRAGDEVVTTVEKLGTLRNTISEGNAPETKIRCSSAREIAGFLQRNSAK